jgi:hypothetical protein
MQRNTSAINAMFARRARRARLRRHKRDIGDTCATCVRLRRIFPRLSALWRLTSWSISHVQPSSQVCISPFIIYFQHRTMFIFTTLHITLYTPSTIISLLRVFYHVLNISSQALVAVSSSGHICIAPHVLTPQQASVLSAYHFHSVPLYNARLSRASRAYSAFVPAPFALSRASRIPPRVVTSGYQLSPLPLRDEHIAHYLHPFNNYISCTLS